MSKQKTPEGYVLSVVMEYLALKGIWFMRMNTGAVKTDDRFIRYGKPGCADILCTPRFYGEYATFIPVVWIECKALNGKQSAAQKAFQAEVETAGHIYKICRSLGDLERILMSVSE